MSPDRISEEADGELLQEYTDSQDAQAFAEITRRHGAMVLGVSQRITRNTHDAEDVVQEAFVELAHKAGSISSLPGWLHRVATNIAKTKIRSAVRRREREQASIEIQDSEPSSWETISPHVDAVLAELPLEMREVMVLHFLEGASQAEIAQRLSMNQSTVSRRLKWGVEQLRVRLRHTGVITSFGILSMLMAENAAATTAPKAVMATLGKMAMVGLGSGESTAGASTSLLHGEMARAAAIIVVGVVGIGALAYFFAEPGAGAPLRTVAADYQLDNGMAAPSGPAAAALAGPRDRVGRGILALSDDAVVGDYEIVTDPHRFAMGSSGRGAAAQIGDLPTLPGDDVAEESPMAGADARGAGGVGSVADMMAGHHGAYRPLHGGGSAAAAGDESLDGAGFGVNGGADGAAGNFANTAAGSSRAIDGAWAVNTATGSGWTGETAAGAEGSAGTGAGSASVSINSFAANAEMLWAFTDMGLYAYDWHSGQWLNGSGGHQLADPTRNIRVDGAGNVIMTVNAGGEQRDQIIGRVSAPTPPAGE